MTNERPQRFIVVTSFPTEEEPASFKEYESAEAAYLGAVFDDTMKAPPVDSIQELLDGITADTHYGFNFIWPSPDCWGGKDEVSFHAIGSGASFMRFIHPLTFLELMKEGKNSILLNNDWDGNVYYNTSLLILD